MPNISLIGDPNQFQSPMFGGRPSVGGTASTIPSGSRAGADTEISEQTLKNIQMLEIMKRIRAANTGGQSGKGGGAPSAGIGTLGAGSGTSVVPAGSIPGI